MATTRLRCKSCGKALRDGEAIFYDAHQQATLCAECTGRSEADMASSKVREFNTGATRDTEEGKLDYEGFLSPRVIRAFGEYMNKHRKQSDGSLRASDNWQKGIPRDVYIKSLWRHFFDIWTEHRGLGSREGMMDALMGTLFNVMGYAHEYIQEQEQCQK